MDMDIAYFIQSDVAITFPLTIAENVRSQNDFAILDYFFQDLGLEVIVIAVKMRPMISLMLPDAYIKNTVNANYLIATVAPHRFLLLMGYCWGIPFV